MSRLSITEITDRPDSTVRPALTVPRDSEAVIVRLLHVRPSLDPLTFRMRGQMQCYETANLTDYLVSSEVKR